MGLFLSFFFFFVVVIVQGMVFDIQGKKKKNIQRISSKYTNSLQLFSYEEERKAQ